MTFLAGACIFLSAFLLFALEPLIAKRILPWFGGSSAVWSVCLVFYQVALLAGYGYAALLARYFRRRAQAVIHIVLLALSLALLPIGPTVRWKPSPLQSPSWLILEMLTLTIGLPFALLAATSPLLQDWLSRGGDQKPYRFFAYSNFASLAALLAYPLLIEPRLTIAQQSLCWSAGFFCFALFCSAFAWRKPAIAIHISEPANHRHLTTEPIYWFALSACASMLLLSVTNHIDENVAAVPLLWILPLAVYLISFIVAFGSSSFYRRSLWLRLLAFALAMLAYAAYDISAVLPLELSIPIYLAGLFIACVFCQGELFRLRPPKLQLTFFYLVIAAGGATGAVFIGLIAPLIFGGIYELPLSLALTAAIALALTWQTGGWNARLLWSGVTASMVAVFFLNWQAYNINALALKRSFYGSLRVVQTAHPGPDQLRTLFHGTIQHGDEYTWPSRRQQPTTYYGPSSGIGILLQEWDSHPKRVGIVGLGAGTLAAYGQPRDVFRFYEINPQVIQLASRFFYFLAQSKAQIEIQPGDARLSLEREKGAPFDILVLDAFSGDAIPVHLLTREAMQLYRSRLRSDGAMAFHISNDYLDLAPVVQSFASDAGYSYVTVQNRPEAENSILASEWVIVTNNRDILENDALKLHALSMKKASCLRVWTDEFSSLLPILKTPEIR